jgi:hypothetical protein
MDILRTEIIESQKSFLELARWKLLGASALAAGALGFGSTAQGSGSWYLLALIPWFCHYIDLLCYTARIRIMVIHHWLRSTEPSQDEPSWMFQYEGFAARSRELTVERRWPFKGERRLNAFGFEDRANVGATVAVCVLILGLDAFAPRDRGSSLVELALIPTSALAVLLLTFLTLGSFRRRVRGLAELAEGQRDQRPNEGG